MLHSQKKITLLEKLKTNHIKQSSPTSGNNWGTEI
jgi:hypothetical protein